MTIKSTLKSQPTDAGQVTEFKEKYYISPQNNFIVANMDDIQKALNNLQLALLYEIHHIMLTKPSREGWDMPHFEGPYETILDLVCDDVFKNSLLVGNRSYYRNLKEVTDVQFYSKRTVDILIETGVKKFCREEGIELRYIDSNFYVEAVQLWLQPETNTVAQKKKVKEQTWKIIQKIKKDRPSEADDMLYHEDRIVFYDDYMLTPASPLLRLTVEEPSAETSWDNFVEKVLKEEN
jgi:hypothetical protein